MIDLLTLGWTAAVPDYLSFFFRALVSIFFGFAVAALYMYRNRFSKNLALTLVLLPVTIQTIITMVSGSIGAGIAVLGAFSLVRFRSIPGNARDIGSLFFAMALGLVAGMGNMLYAFIFLVLFSLSYLALVYFRFGQKRRDPRLLRILIPENLDYQGLFDDILARYTLSYELERVRTTSMGSLFELSYLVQLGSPELPKELIDELRSRNGNLNILLSRERFEGEEL
ncbi:MAG: DUF4956 domain-containing protein [Treponema sp.]|nr:DUF4956 domain-containing protein [Treponema sp.]